MRMENYNNAHGQLQQCNGKSQQCTWKITTMHMENLNGLNIRSFNIIGVQLF